MRCPRAERGGINLLAEQPAVIARPIQQPGAARHQLRHTVGFGRSAFRSSDGFFQSGRELSTVPLLVRSGKYLSEFRNEDLVGKLVVFFQIVHGFLEVHLLDDGYDLRLSLFSPFFALGRGRW